MYLSHPLRITLCQIVIDCYHADSFSFQRIQVCRERGYQCFSFTGLHLGNTSLVQDDSADNLHSVVLHAKHTARRLTDNCICLCKKVVKGFPFFQTLFKFPGLIF